MSLNGDYIVPPGVLSTNISGLEAGTTYAIKVQTTNTEGAFSAGNRVLLMKTASPPFFGPDTVTDPATPAVDTANAALNNEVSLTWGAAEGITSNPPFPGDPIYGQYEIRWDPPYGGVQPQTISAALTSATIADLYPNARYTFRIKSISWMGDSSPGLASVVAATASNVGPRDPTNFSTDPGYPPSDTAVGLEWSIAQTLGGAELSGYVITWQPPDGPGYALAGPFDVDKVVSGLSSATTYSFNIVAVDTSDNDSPGNYYVSATTTDIGGLRAPTNLRAVGTPGITSITMAWNPAIASLPDTVTCNVIMAYDVSEDYELPPQTTGGGSLSNYTFTDLSSNTLYRFSLEAFSETGSQMATNTFEQRTSIPNAPFDPSLNVTAAGYNYVSFDWTLSGDGTNGGANLSDFYIDYFNMNTGSATVRHPISGGATASNTTVFNLNTNTEYSFTIYARNLSGFSSPGGPDAKEEVQTATVGTPLAPGGLQPHPYIPATSNSISVMWNSAYKGSATNAAVTNHIVRVYPAPDGISTVDVGEDTTITIPVAPDTSYEIWVRGVNASGGIGNEAGPITIRSEYDLPGGVGDVAGLRFSGIVGEDTIPIAWASSGFNDGVYDPSGYRIEYDAV